MDKDATDVFCRKKILKISSGKGRAANRLLLSKFGYITDIALKPNYALRCTVAKFNILKGFVATALLVW